MKYDIKVVGKAMESLLSHMNSDPAMVRRRFNKEPEVLKAITEMCERAAIEARIQDDNIIELMVNTAVYGFFFRESLAAVVKGDNNG